MEWLNLPLAEVLEILGNDDLNAKSEETTFQAAVRWLEHGEKDSTAVENASNPRRAYVADILGKIRTGLVSNRFFFETISRHEYIKDSSAAQPLLEEARRHIYDLRLGSTHIRAPPTQIIDMNHPLMRPRNPHEFLLVVGGWSGGSATSRMESYDIKADRWSTVGEFDTGPRAYHSTLQLGNEIYMIGGFDGIEQFSSCRIFNPLTLGWREMAPMHHRRCYVSAVPLAGKVYAMGGCDRQQRLNSAEVYEPATNQWTLLPRMAARRSDADAAVLSGKIYICGGFNGEECMSSAECYDPETSTWSAIAAMNSRRSGVSVEVLGEFVYAVGGFNGSNRLTTAERYNPLTNTWVYLPEMKTPRSNFGISVLDGMLFVCGGFNGTTTISNVECYDPEMDAWYEVADMTIDRSAVSVCRVTAKVNKEKFIFPRNSLSFSIVRTSISQNVPHATGQVQRPTALGNPAAFQVGPFGAFRVLPPPLPLRAAVPGPPPT